MPEPTVPHRRLRSPAFCLVALLLSGGAAGRAHALITPPPARLAASRAAVRLSERGVHPAIAERSARHVLLGLPSEADRSNDKDLLLARNGYVVAYNGERNAMNWASWSVRKSDLAPMERKPRFRADPTLPAGLYRPTNDDFKIPGFSRGHMVRSGERTATTRANSKTYVFPNILVQAQNNNTGPWNAFENYYLDQVDNGGHEVHVIAGGVFGAPPAQPRGVAVPSATWKIVALLRPGQTLEQVSADTRVVAVLMPNNNDDVKVEHLWERYRVPVAEIERQTGLKFFDHLPPQVADQLRSRVDTAAIPPPLPPKFTPHNYVSQQLLASGLRGEVVAFDADKGYGFIRRDDGQRDVFVHIRQLRGPVAPGDRVLFDLAPTEDGRSNAVGVRMDGAPGAWR